MTATARNILVTAITLPLLTAASQADVLSKWTFEDNTIYNLGNGAVGGTGPTVTGTSPGVFAADQGVLTTGSEATGLHAAATTVWSGPVGNASSKSLSANTWAVGDYFQFKASTTGFDTIQVSWDQMGSNTGPRDFDFAYSTNGTDFTVLPALNNYVVTNDGWGGSGTPNPVSTRTADLSSIAALTNQTFVYIRLIVDSTSSINGGTVATGGTGRVDNFTISGQTFIPSVDRYWDGNGATAGFGGPGTWTNASVTWNDAADGTGAVAALAAQQRAVFKGTAGTITIGTGADANAGLRFESGGYVLSGAGTINLSSTGANRIEVVNAADTATINAALSGSTGLEKIGPGTLVLGGNNTFTGTFKLTAGTLQITNDSALGDSANALSIGGATLKTIASTTLNSNRAVSGTGTLDIAPGSALTVAGAATTGLLVLANSGALMLTGPTPSIGGLTFMQAATVTSTDAISLSGNLTANNTGGTTTLNTTVDFGSTSRTIAVNDGSAAVDLQITGNLRNAGTSGTTTLAIVKTGSGTLDVLGTNNSFGQIQLGITGNTPTDGGVLVVHNTSGLGAGIARLNVGTVRNSSGGLLSLSIPISLGGQGATGAILEGGDFEILGSITTGTAPNTTTTTGLTIFQNSAVTPYAQKLTANSNIYLTSGLNDVIVSTSGGSGPATTTSLGIIFAGTGRVIMNSATNSFSLPITVTDGVKFDVQGSLTGVTQGKITVTNSGSLTGKQDAASSLGAVEIGANGILAPGTVGDINVGGGIIDTTATINTKNLTIDAGGFYQISLAGTGTGLFDQVNVTGAVTLTGGFFQMILEGAYVPAKNDTFLIINNDSNDAIVGEFANAASNQIFKVGPQFFQLNYAGGDGNDLVLITVPEPASAGLFLLGGLGLATLRRRRKA